MTLNLNNRIPPEGAGQKRIWFSQPIERTIHQVNHRCMMQVAMRAGILGYTYIDWAYSRTDIARNHLARRFMSLSSHLNDTLVMLDDDHVHPPDIIERLVAWDVPIVAALAFRRGEPFFPCFFQREADGYLHLINTYEKGLAMCSVTGMAAIAIQRKVFLALDEAGFSWPWFRYLYPAGEDVHPSEDIYFGEICEKAGIPMSVDTTLVSPHLTDGVVDESSWEAWKEDHPEAMNPDFNWQEVIKVKHDEPGDKA